MTNSADPSYSFEEFIIIMKKLNIRSELLTRIWDNILPKSREPEYKEAVLECVNKIQIKSYRNASECAEGFHKVFERIKNDDDDFDSFLLTITNQIIFLKRKYYLRLNQYIAALCAIKSEHGVLQQLATGEGKSIIVMSVSIVSVLKGLTTDPKRFHVNIVTSSPTLAKRDTVCEPPVGCLDIYKEFGIKASHICIDSPSIRSQRYAECQIIYGDLSSFQRDFLLDNFYSENIVGSRGYDVIIVDEVDSMLFDQGSNMLYLSHEIPDLEMLQPLFVKIWQIVNATMENSVDKFNDKLIFQSIYRCVFPLFLLQHFGDMLGITEEDATAFKDILIRRKVISVDGEILMTNKSDLKRVLSLNINLFDDLRQVSDTTINRFIYSYDRVMGEERLNIPDHLHDFVKRHLKEYILNAKSAFFMKEGEGYEVDMARVEGTLNFQPKIIIVDIGTGVDLPTTTWSNGLHQFLQLKHALKLTAVSTKAVFTSNISFLKMFKHFYGFSGTLGAEAERLQLTQMYNLESIILPSSKPKQFFEEPSIVNTTIEAHATSVLEAIEEKMKDDRSVLIICESIKQVNELSKNVKELALKCAENAKPYENVILYRRDHEKFEYGEGKQLEPKIIIFATNLAGRGTDIKLSDELRKNGGLHVIVAFLPINMRVEEQAFGRAARCGDDGTAQLIVYADEAEHGKDIHFAKLKSKRNAEEVRRIQKIKDYYENVLLIEEDCFKHFCKKFKLQSKRLDEIQMDEERKKLVLRDRLDQWALWLDKTGYEKYVGKQRIATAEQFCEHLVLTNTPYNLLLTQPLNIMKYALLEANTKNLENAENLFKQLRLEYKAYSAEVNYYLAFVFIQKHRNITQSKKDDYNHIEKLLEDARLGFEKRLFSFYNDRSIIEHYRKEENNRIFKSDAFTQQQMEMAQLMNLFIDSIDSLLGGRIDSCDFMTELINEEVSYTLYQKFRDTEIFHELPITDTKIKDIFESSKLQKYCQMRGVSEKIVSDKIKSFEDRRVDVKEITNAMNPATVEHFWNELKAKNLIVDIKQHVFVSTKKYSTLNSKLVKFIKIHEKMENNELEEKEMRLFQHSFVIANKWKELDLKMFTTQNFNHEIKIKEFENDMHKPCFDLLLEMGVLCKTESAKLIDKNETEISKIGFDQFSTITKNDFLIYGIPEIETENILNILVDTKVLKVRSNHIYELIHTQNTEKEETKNEVLEEKIKRAKFPDCYAAIIPDILKQKFAFVICYRNLQQDKRDKSAILKISLPTFEECSPVFDLLDLGVVERSNVNKKKLDINLKSTNFLKKVYNYVMDNEASDNVSKVALTAALICEDNLTTEKEKKEKSALEEKRKNDSSWMKKIENSITDVITEENLINYSEVKKDIYIEHIRNLFNEKTPAHYKIDTLEATLIPLWDKLVECNLIELRNTCLMVVNGTTHLIKFSEQKWSWKTIGKLAAVTLGAIAQLAVGSVIMVCSAGTGVFVANFFISEAISDLIYVLKGVCTGYADNYKQHKIMSMLASGVLCGAGGLFASGGQFNSVANGIFGTGWTSAGLNHVALKGSALIAKATLKTVVKETAKQIGKKNCICCS